MSYFLFKFIFLTTRDSIFLFKFDDIIYLVIFTLSYQMQNL